MVAVAIVAGGSAEVVSLQERLAVNGSYIVVNLVGRYAVIGHMDRIGVATPAGG